MLLNKTHMVQFVNINLCIGCICGFHRDFLKHESRIWRFIIRLCLKKYQKFRYDETINSTS